VKASLYVHIPFCASKCAYCDFFSVPASPSSPVIDEYLEALRRDISAQLSYFKVDGVPSVYIGGGTPSLLGGARIAGLLSFINGNALRHECEITVEANSESLSEGFVRACVEGGATRLSVGVQSLNDEARRAVGRRGSSRRTQENLTLLKDIPIDLSFDMLSGLPHQDEAGLLRDLETLLSYGPAHLSLYDLMVEEGPLPRAAREKLPDAETKEAMWIAGRDFLERAGFAQYEVSNFAREGKRARHNIRYWMMESWIACGPQASGTVIDDESATAIRYTAGRNIRRYISSPPFPAGRPVERIDARTLLKETLMMGYRCLDGPDEALFQKRFSCCIDSAIPQTIAAWRARNLYHPTKNALTPQGLLFLNRFLLDCFLEEGATGSFCALRG
jgi:oxygen-independent coproporphyrinogen-3 oxidase